MTYRESIFSIALVLALVFTPNSALSSTPPAGKVTQVKGNATLQRVGLKDILPVHFSDAVFLQDKITTKKQSFVRVLLGGKALVTVRELSVLTITEEENHATIDMLSGIMSLSVARKRMKPGEYIEIRTPHGVAVVRGTIAVTEVFDTTTFSLITGDMGVGPLGSKLENLITLPAGNQVQMTDQGMGTPQEMPPNVQQQKAKLADAPDQPDESPVEEQVAQDQGDQALALAETLAPDTNNTDGETEEGENTTEDDSTQDQGDDTDGEGDGGLLTETSPEGGTTSPPTSQTDTPVISITVEDPIVLPPPDQPALLIENQTLAVTVGAPVFQFSGTLNRQGQSPVAQINNSTVTGGGSTLFDHGAIIGVTPGANVSLEGPVVNIFNSTIGTVADPLTTILGVNGSSLSSSFTGSLLTVDPSSFVGTNLVRIINGGSLSTTSTLFTGIDSTFNNQAGGLAAAFVGGGSSLSVGGPFIDLQNSTLNLGNFPVLRVFGASTVEHTTGPVIRLNDSTLIASSLLQSDGTGNTGQFTGSALDLTNSTVILQTLANDAGPDDFTLTLNLNEPEIRMNNSSLTLTAFDPLDPFDNDLVGFDPNPMPIRQGTALAATNNSTLNLAGSLTSLSGNQQSALTFQSTVPIIQLTGTTVTQQISAVPVPLIFVAGPNTGESAGNLPVIVNSSLLASVNSSMNAPNDLFHVDNPFTSLTANPVLDLNATTVTAGGNIALVTGAMTLTGQLINDINGNLTVGESLFQSEGGTTSSTGAGTFIEFNGTNFTAQSIDLVTLFGGGSLTLSSGSLFHPNNSTILVDDSVFFSDSATVQAGGSMPFIHLTGTTTLANTSNVFPLLGDINEGSVTVADTLVHLENTVNATTTQGAIEFSNATVMIGQHAIEMTENSILNVGEEIVEVLGGSLDVGNSFLVLRDSATTSADEGVLGLIGATVTIDGDLARIRGNSTLTVGEEVVDMSGGSLDVSGSVLAQTGLSTVTVGAVAINVESASLTTTNGGHGISLTSGTLNLGESALDLNGINSTATFDGGFFQATNATVTPSSTTPFISLAGGATYTSLGPTLDLINTDLDLGTQSLASFSNASTFDSAMEPRVRINGGTFTALSLLNSDASGNTLRQTGNILNLTDATVNLTSLGTGFNLAVDTITRTRALNEAFVRMTDSTINLTGLGFALVLARAGNESLADPTTQQGVGLIANGGAINLNGALAVLNGFTTNLAITATDTFLQLTDTNVTGGGGNGALIIGSGPVTLAGPLMTQMGDSDIISIGDVVLLLGNLTVTAPTFITVAGTSSLSALGNLIEINDPGFLNRALAVSGTVLTIQDTATVDLGQGVANLIGGSLTTTNGGHILQQLGGSYQGGDSILDVIGISASATVDGHVVDLQGGTLTTTNGGHVVNIEVGTVTLANSVLAISGASTTATIAGNVVNVSGSVLNGANTASLIDVSQGTLNVTGSLLDVGSAAATVNLRGGIGTFNGGTTNAGTGLAMAASTTLSPLSPTASETTTIMTGANNSLGIAVTPDGTRVYASNRDDDLVSVINTATNSVIATVGVGDEPGQIALSPDGTRAYVTNDPDNTVSVLDTANNTVVATVMVGTNPNGVALTPDGTLAYVANRNSSNVSVIDTATNTVVASVNIGGVGPAGVALSPNGRRAYVPFGSNRISVIDTATNQEVDTIQVGSGPVGVALTPDGSRAYVTNRGDDTVSVINTATNTVVATIGVGNFPFDVAITPDGTRAFVANGTDDTVSVIDTATNTVVATVGVSSGSFVIALTPDGTRAYVTAGNLVSVIDGITAPLFQVKGDARLTLTSNTLVDVPATATLTLERPALDILDSGSVTDNDDLISVGGTLTLNGRAPLVLVRGQGQLTLNENLVENNGGTLDIGGAILHVREGGQVTSTTANDLVLLLNSTVNLATETGISIFEFLGINTGVDGGTGITVGTDTPYVPQGGNLLEAQNTTVTTDRIVKIDTALLVATAPLVNLINSTVNATPPDANAGAIDLSFRAKVMTDAPILAMDNSIMNVNSGSFASLANQTILSLSGDFISLINGSALNITSANGFLVSASGNSALNVTGALINFGGTGNNVVLAQNSAFSESINGVAFSFINGATNGQVSVNGTPIQNAGLGAVNLPNGGSLIQVDGPDAIVTIQGQ